MLDDPGIKLTTLGAAVVVKLAFMARAIIVESLCNAKGILGRNRKPLECNSSYYESSSTTTVVDSRARARSKEIFQVQAEKSTTVGIVVGVSIELLRTSFEICSKLVD
jgi:hypothetical protein